MLRLQPIQTASPYYEFMEKLLVDSFPPEEYRELSELRRFTDSRPSFHNHIILDADTPIGLVTYWDFDEFFYVEHFAIHPDCRSVGYGGQILQLLFAQLHRPIVLEVEMPTGEMEQRRIRFYERHGFILWEIPYLQPPYRPGSEYLPMCLMAYGDLSCYANFEQVKNIIYFSVYQVSE